MIHESLPQEILSRFFDGQVIPAHPLALTADYKLDETHQRALSRYYLASGAGGLAVGVHTTQFKIHEPQIGLYRPVLELAMSVAREKKREHPPVMIAGICGGIDQAAREAALAKELGYHFGMVCPNGFKGENEDQIVSHCREIAEVIPIVGFYLQTAVGGRIFSEEFWRKLVEIPNLIGIKIAAFNRYQTLEVLRAVANSGRAGQVALYTGNDDNLVVDLLTRFHFKTDAGQEVSLSIVGGLLGHWACWTSKAVELLTKIKQVRFAPTLPAELLTLAAQVTESNEALFDPSHQFQGANPGILYALKQAGLVRGIYMLDDHERLSPGQAAKIDAIRKRYPALVDDEFVAKNMAQWLKP